MTSPLSVEQIFDVDNGAMIVDNPVLAAPSADLGTFASEYIDNDLGTTVTATAPATITESYAFLLPAQSALKNVTLLYTIECLHYTFTYLKGTDQEQTYEVNVENIIGRTYSNTAALLNQYIGHGHGHAHGHAHADTPNSGGGIWE
jgi:hypothetical protein